MKPGYLALAALPAHSRRAPLRRHDPDRGDRRPGLFPPIQGGLHCGHGGYESSLSQDSGLFPPIQGGLHCGKCSDDGKGSYSRYSSRPFKAGSIAASGLPELCGTANRALPAHSRRAPLRPGRVQPHPALEPGTSSRPFKAGSIAAGVPDVRGRAGKTPLPAHSRRAPLRRTELPGGGQPVGQLFPPIQGGLHCGVARCRTRVRAVRRSSRPFKAGSIAAPTSSGRCPPTSRLFPPIQGGLHCGDVPAANPGDPCALFPPIQGGLHCGPAGGIWPEYTSSSLFPPIQGGLHCGCSSLRMVTTETPLFPPIQGGLHCGLDGQLDLHPAGQLFPPIQGGLHCGAPGERSVLRMSTTLPAHSRRAPLRPGRGEDQDGADEALPAHSRRAPLRLVYPQVPPGGEPALPAHSRRAPLRLHFLRTLSLE